MLYLVSGDPGETLVTTYLKPKILITDTTLESFSKEELKGVIEREIAHVKFKHDIITLTYTVIALGIAISAIAHFAHHRLSNLLVGLSVFLQQVLASILFYIPLAFYRRDILHRN